jgi:hypothetical protein
MRKPMNTEKTLKEPPFSLSEAWEKEAKVKTGGRTQLIAGLVAF